MAQALQIVYRRPLYLCGTLIGATFISIAVLAWPNLALVQYVIQSHTTTSANKLNLLGSLLVATPESIGWASVLLVLSLALLLAMVVSMLWYIYQNKLTAPTQWRRVLAATGTGTIAGLFGIGCVACGPLLFGGLLATVSASTLLILLPWHGLEVGLVALVLLVYALFALAKIITAPLVCAG